MMCRYVTGQARVALYVCGGASHVGGLLEVLITALLMVASGVTALLRSNQLGGLRVPWN